MAIQFKNEAFVDVFQLESKDIVKPVGIPDSNSITGIEVRLTKAHIIDNKTEKVWPFPGYSQLYVVELVVSNVGNMLHTFDIKPLAKVGDGEDLPIEKTLYYWKQKEEDDINPSQIHVLTSIIKSKQNLRNVGNIMADVKNDKEFGDLVGTLKNAFSAAGTIEPITNLLFSLASVVGKFLGKVDDNPLITWVQSFTDLYGDFDKLGVTKRSVSNRFASLELAIVIRDTSREKVLAGMNDLILEEIEIAEKGSIA